MHSAGGSLAHDIRPVAGTAIMAAKPPPVQKNAFQRLNTIIISGAGGF